MKNLGIALLLTALTFTACNKKTAQQKTAPAATIKKETTPQEKKATSLDELKGKKVEAKQLPEDKLDDVQKARTSNPEGSYKSYYETGYEKHNSGDFQGAINDFSKSIEMNPQYSDSYTFRGMSRYKSGDKSGACADWEKAASMGDASAQEMFQKNCK
jgi:tetratricopeptide (TPR) repeat protein